MRFEVPPKISNYLTMPRDILGKTLKSMNFVVFDDFCYQTTPCNYDISKKYVGMIVF